MNATEVRAERAERFQEAQLFTEYVQKICDLILDSHTELNRETVRLMVSQSFLEGMLFGFESARRVAMKNLINKESN